MILAALILLGQWPEWASSPPGQPWPEWATRPPVAAEAPEKPLTYAEAYKQFQARKVPLVVMLHPSFNCPWCEKLERELKPWEHSEDVILVHVTQGKDAVFDRLRWDSGFPQTVCFHPNRAYYRHAGYLSASAMAAKLKLSGVARSATAGTPRQHRASNSRLPPDAKRGLATPPSTYRPVSTRQDFINRWGWVPSRRTRCNCPMCREAKRLYAAGLLAAGEWSEELPPSQMPTPPEVIRQVGAMLRPSDVLYDLGCGDGRMLVEAHRRGVRRAVGVEIDPAMAGVARWHTQGMGTVEVVEGDAIRYSARGLGSRAAGLRASGEGHVAGDRPVQTSNVESGRPAPSDATVVFAYLWEPVLAKIDWPTDTARMIITYAHPVPGLPMQRVEAGEADLWVWRKPDARQTKQANTAGTKRNAEVVVAKPVASASSDIGQPLRRTDRQASRRGFFRRRGRGKC